MSNEDTKYNGWSNYETWNWKLWIDNDEGSASYYAELAQDCYECADSEYDWETIEQARIRQLADVLQSDSETLAEDWMPNQSGPFCDLLNSAIGRIDWREIAESLLNDVEES